MSDDTQDTAVAEETTTKAKRAPAERIAVLMNDGKTIEFVGKAKLTKDPQDDGSVRFDFRNGYTRTVRPADSLYAKLVAHGTSQKCGDATSGIEDIDDMQVALDAVADRLEAGEWGVERKGGDGFSGASVVIRAVMEATGKSQADVKGFLDAKLKSNADLTRQDLYKSFRKPGTKTAAIIERLEREKLTASAKMDGDELLAELEG